MPILINLHFTTTLDTICDGLKTKGQQKPKNSVLHSLPSEQNHTYKTNKCSLQYTDGLVHTYMHTKNCVVSWLIKSPLWIALLAIGQSLLGYTDYNIFVIV